MTMSDAEATGRCDVYRLAKSAALTRRRCPHICSIILGLLAAAIFGCSSDETTTDESADINAGADPSSMERPTIEEIEAQWAAYNIEPPSEEMTAILQEHPAVYPHQVCLPYEGSGVDVASSYLSQGDEGENELCIWHHPAGCVPAGSKYADLASCDVVRTLGPSWFIPPIRHVESDLTLLDDPSFRKELKWVTEQASASGCACCHASESSGYASYFDIDAPGIWTDTMSMTGILMAAGLSDDHKHLGYLPAADNFGYDRETTLFATTDVERMRAFFEAEFERRGGTTEDIGTAEAQFRQINRGLFAEPTECIPGEGVDPQGRVVWKGTGSARQLYIQEVGSENPGSPPNLDKPEGTVWALYADDDAPAIPSGTVIPGQTPQGARQAVPADELAEVVLEEGKRYRLFVTPDFMRSYLANCEFTYGAAPERPQIQTCGSDGVLCLSVTIPETLSETPEKMVVALYRQLPPIGPPDVFPVYSQDQPALEPGDTVEVRLDAREPGNFRVFAVLYMPGGGVSSWMPSPGVDFTAASEPIELTGDGVTLDEELILEIAE